MASDSRVSNIPQGDKKIIRGWVLYDWANSVYQLTIASAIFPIYYNQVTRTGNDFIVDFFGLKIINTVLYSWAIAAAYLLVAVFSPLLSSIADYTGRRKAFMKAFTWIGAAACGALFFFDSTTIELGVIAFALGTLGYGGSIVFYNSFLPIIAAPEDQDRVSARGYAMGYLGGVLLLVMNLVLILKPDWFGITDPLLPAKLARGKSDEVDWCTLCDNCIEFLIRQEPVGCATYQKEYARRLVEIRREKGRLTEKHT